MILCTVSPQNKEYKMRIDNRRCVKSIADDGVGFAFVMGLGRFAYGNGNLCGVWSVEMIVIVCGMYLI